MIRLLLLLLIIQCTCSQSIIKPKIGKLSALLSKSKLERLNKGKILIFSMQFADRKKVNTKLVIKLDSLSGRNTQTFEFKPSDSIKTGDKAPFTSLLRGWFTKQFGRKCYAHIYAHEIDVVPDSYLIDIQSANNRHKTWYVDFKNHLKITRGSVHICETLWQKASNKNKKSYGDVFKHYFGAYLKTFPELKQQFIKSGITNIDFKIIPGTKTFAKARETIQMVSLVKNGIIINPVKTNSMEKIGINESYFNAAYSYCFDPYPIDNSHHNFDIKSNYLKANQCLDLEIIYNPISELDDRIKVAGHLSTIHVKKAVCLGKIIPEKLCIEAQFTGNGQLRVNNWKCLYQNGKLYRKSPFVW